MRTLKLLSRYQSGQAYAETLVGFSVIALFLFGAYHLWRYAEMQQVAVDAVRFAAWERVVWEPSDNSVEKFALHKSDEQLATDTVLRQLSTPAAWRNFRTGLSDKGEPKVNSVDVRRELLGAASKSFVSPGYDSANLISLTTSSGWTDQREAKFRGKDPTFNTTTSLELDRETYRTVNLSLKSQLDPKIGARFFDFLLPAVDTKKRFSLITNAWAASTPVMFVRTERQLLPFSSGDNLSGTNPNKLAFFGLNPSPDANAADFVGMVPFWNFVGGPNGFAGQYTTDQTGVGAAWANSLVQSKGQSFKDFNWSTPGLSSGLMAEMQRNEYFQPNNVSNQIHKHISVTSQTDEDKAEPGIKSRNSNIARRKYRAFSRQNPIENYFTRPN